MKARHKLIYVVIFSVISISLSHANAAPPKAGSACSKLGKKQVSSGKTFTCIKKGRNLIWSKGVKNKEIVNPVKPSPIPTSSTSPSPEVSIAPVPTAPPNLDTSTKPIPEPTPTVTFTEPPMKFSEKLWSRGNNGIFPIEKESFATPSVVPTNWDDVFEKRLGIPFQAWSSVSKNIANNDSKVGKVEILVGPNTVPNYPEIKSVMELVSRAVPSARNTMKVRVFAFNFQDSSWADAKFRDLYQNETAQFKKNHSDPINEICPKNREVCFQQAFIDSNQEAVLIIGMTDKGSREQINQTYAAYARSFLGFVIAHEYFHTIEALALGDRRYDVSKRTPSWFSQGAAVFMEGSAPNHDSFDRFQRFRLVDSGILYRECPYEFCVKLDFSKIVDFLSMSHYEKNWDNFPYAMKYSMSARVIEILVALKGPDSLVSIFEQIGRGLSFVQAFEYVYGLNFETAKPIIARILVDQFENGR